MTKHDHTHARLLQQGLEIISVNGFAGATIGGLAERAMVSKSGVFAHFGSAEALRLELLKTAAELAQREIVEPALLAPAGLPRLRRLFELWLGWASRSGLPGGCPFVSAAAEFDDVEGASRDFVVATLYEFIGLFISVIEEAQKLQELDAKLESKSLAWQLFGLYNTHHAMQRLMRDPQADRVALQGFETLVQASGPDWSDRREPGDSP